MKELQDYKELIRKGADNYISILKHNGLYEEVLRRIKRKNGAEPVSLIKQIFEKQSNFSEYLFSDFNYSLDFFYDDFEINLKQVIDLSFQDLKCDYQIITDFQDRQTQELKKSISYYSDGKQDEIAPAVFASLVNCSKMQWRIILNQGRKNFQFNWVDFGEENLINFLNFINDICKTNDNQFKWFPIASSYGSDFIFTTEKHYNSIIELNLMPPVGYEIDEIAKVHYPEGIKAAKNSKKGVLPVSNISCEVPMEKKEKNIYVKLWRISKEGNLNIDEIPKKTLQKLKTLSNVCNKMNWDYGKIIIDTNKILSDKEIEKIVVGVSIALRNSVQNKSIDLKNRVISLFRNDVNSLIETIEIKTDDNKS